MIENRSFEGIPADASMPQGWMSMSAGTTPDILPGFWGVYNRPSEGKTYLGLITRPNASFESIGQRLGQSLKAGICYRFSIDLAYSDNYAGFNKHQHLRIWISDKKSRRQQVIFLSPRITHSDWKTYEIEFTPEKESWYIILEAFISDDPVPYKGNILLDKLQNIYPCSRA